MSLVLVFCCGEDGYTVSSEFVFRQEPCDCGRLRIEPEHAKPGQVR